MIIICPPTLICVECNPDLTSQRFTNTVSILALGLISNCREFAFYPSRYRGSVPRTSWKFRRSSGKPFSLSLDRELDPNVLEFNQSFERLCKIIGYRITWCVKKAFPRGTVVKCKCSWPTNVMELKSRRDRFRTETVLN
ncbi:hypothetical protein CDAR_72021 [Caerostris darwini]|uniref:Uncharacterized protein n=1 Tax=Caerostris darwini TaxID=1538125 RepID=A0AAV4SAE3_9ARAC|nr:hypothetical protein CDAR_72021 [Caerostris darwini]